MSSKIHSSRLILVSAYCLSVLFVALSLLGLLFALAAGSELFMPFVATNRLPIIERGYYDHSHELGWRLKPNLQIDLITQDEPPKVSTYFSTNSAGFRSTPAFKANLPTGIVLGDSMAQGFYLTDRQSLPWRLAEITQTNVINAGVGGYSSDQELILLEKVIRKDIKWVVLLFFANDLPWNLERASWGLHKPRFQIDENGKVNFKSIEPPMQSNTPHEASSTTNSTIKNPARIVQPATSADPWERVSSPTGSTICCAYDGKKQWRAIKEKFLAYFALTPEPQKLITRIREDYKWIFPYPGQYSYILPKPFYTEPQSFTKQWSVAFQMMSRMKAISEAHGAHFYVAYVPEIGQILNQDGISDAQLPQQFFMQQCEKNGLLCLDPSADFKKDGTNVFVQDDGHLSPIGANVLAKLIATNLNTSATNKKP